MDSIHLKDPAIGQRARKALNEAMSAARTAQGTAQALQTAAPISASTMSGTYSSMQAALDDAAERKRTFVFDQDTVLDGDILITRPVHIVLPVGVTVTVRNSPNIQHYAENEAGDRYAGIFSLREGAETSVFEFWGTMVGPTQAAANEVICPVLAYGMEGHARFFGEPIISGMPAGRIAVLSPSYVSDWGGGVIGPLGPWVNEP